MTCEKKVTGLCMHACITVAIDMHVKACVLTTVDALIHTPIHVFYEFCYSYTCVPNRCSVLIHAFLNRVHTQIHKEQNKNLESAIRCMNAIQATNSML